MKKKKREKKNAVWFAALLIIFGAVFFLSFMWGKYSISPGEIFRMIAERITGAESGIPAAKEKVFFNIRLPRVLGACIVGGGLAVSGCVYQGTMRNPMVSPDILGATAGAGMGAALALLLSWSAAGRAADSFCLRTCRSRTDLLFCSYHQQEGGNDSVSRPHGNRHVGSV